MDAAIEKVLENQQTIRECKQAEEALRVSEELFSKAFHSSPIAMSIHILENGRIVDTNDSFCRLTGYSREQTLGHTIAELGIWVDPQAVKLIGQKLLNREKIHELEINFRNKAGEQRVVLFSSEIIDINFEACLLNIITDITDRKKAEEEIRYLSFYDRLTGLYNRAFFEEELKRMDTERQLPISLIMGDLNGLKLINDSMGHYEGDRLLIKAGQILKQACRREDIVARWGGDEFIILLPRCDSEAAARIVRKVNEYCKNNEGFPIDLSISLGMACKTDHTQNMQKIMKEAEDKMYRHKLMETRSTRNTFIRSLEKTLWANSHETQEHCLHLQEIALKLARLAELSENEISKLKMLACFHDIGKIAIPGSILNKAGKYSPEDWETMKRHPEIGYRIALSSPELAPIAEGILFHHEHWDGRGYPIGLKGEEIPLISRIIAVADTYSVLVNGRPYREPVSSEAAWQEISKCAGTQFDPELVIKALTLSWQVC
ncbi:MAG: diguanylate cyclase [Syntrophomonadaceae bacterium]|nr:diguanylate cyclase [Syntrophomonadaceae bacterium]